MESNKKKIKEENEEKVKRGTMERR